VYIYNQNLQLIFYLLLYMEKYFQVYSKKKLIDELKKNKKLKIFYLNYLKNYVFKLSNSKKKATLINAIDHIKYDKNAYSDHKTIILKINDIYVGITNLIILNGAKSLGKPLNLKKDALYLYSSYVKPKYRGRGINGLMIKYIQNKFKFDIYIIIKNDNTPSIKSYIKSGYKKTNTKSHYGNDYYYYIFNGLKK
jgi:hypothetical protein